MLKNQTALIIGAGPAGLTAAYELLKRTEIKPIVLECSDMVGGISRTVNYKGNRIDIGGHRFFSKSDRVMQWWLEMMPIEDTATEEFAIQYQGQRQDVRNPSSGVDPERTDAVMLVRQRHSRIFFLRKFFDYPIQMSLRTLRNLGLLRMARILASYLKARVAPIKDEQNLEQFFINRFGRELYRTFFKSYTEKVWGVPCHAISAEWGAQRIKGLSITKAILYAGKRLFRRDKTLGQKGVETSLIERFLYPKHGPGQMWEVCAEKVTAMGGEVILNSRVCQVLNDGERVTGIVARDTDSGDEFTLIADYVFSTMPVQELIRAFDRGVPEDVRRVSEGLIYRDFITVGLLVEELKIKENHGRGSRLLSDNWIYIQEPDVMLGRLQLFNNWSPYMVADSSHVWLGMEYFCNESDPIWNLSDDEMIRLGVDELQTLGFIDGSRVVDATVIRMAKTYPAYFGSYEHFDTIKEFVDGIENLFLIGRNGMHRYNNQDHSMLTAMTAVDNIVAGRRDKQNIWNINTEQEYHEQVEEKTATPEKPVAAPADAPAETKVEPVSATN